MLNTTSKIVDDNEILWSHKFWGWILITLDIDMILLLPPTKRPISNLILVVTP